MLVVGLTGGIASGKTTVTRLFEQRGVPVLDADVVARQVVQPQTQGLARVVAEFGQVVIAPDGTLDRQALRQRVFDSPDQRQRLEAILHPLIRAELERQLSSLSTPYAILAAPLLIEAGLTDLVDRLLVVDVPEAIQVARVMARDSSSRAEAHRIIASQISRAERLARADDVIENTAGVAALEPQVDRLHKLYLQQGKRP